MPCKAPFKAFNVIVTYATCIILSEKAGAAVERDRGNGEDKTCTEKMQWSY